MEGYVARQAIYDRNRKVAAYELLYRGGPQALSAGTPGDGASEEVVSNGFFSIGWQTLVGDRPALWNVGQQLLMSEKILIIPPERVYVEILETTEATEEVLQRCKWLRERGYRLILDDYTGEPGKERLLEMCHMVKVDWRDSSERVRRDTPSSVKRKCLAEKVETIDEVEHALELGYDYVQGYALERPQVLSGRKLPAAQVCRLKLIAEISKAEPAMSRVEELIERDVDLTFKLMTWVNSAASGRRHPASTVREALIWMGLEQVRRFVSMFAMAGLNGSGNAELLEKALIRARMSDLVATAIGDQQDGGKAFLGGLVSMLDAMLGKPIEEICSEMGLPDEIRGLFEGQTRGAGSPAKLGLQLAKAWQSGEETAAEVLAQVNSMPASELSSYYLNSIVWVHDSRQV